MEGHKLPPRGWRGAAAGPAIIAAAPCNTLFHHCTSSMHFTTMGGPSNRRSLGSVCCQVMAAQYPGTRPQVEGHCARLQKNRAAAHTFMLYAARRKHLQRQQARHVKSVSSAMKQTEPSTGGAGTLRSSLKPCGRQLRRAAAAGRATPAWAPSAGAPSPCCCQSLRPPGRQQASWACCPPPAP